MDTAILLAVLFVALGFALAASATALRLAMWALSRASRADSLTGWGGPVGRVVDRSTAVVFYSANRQILRQERP